MKIRAGFALAAGLLAVLPGGTGCATPIAGTATLPGGMPHLSLGDRTRLDPCSLLRPEDLNSGGQVKLDNDGFFDTCVISRMRSGSPDSTDEAKTLRLQISRNLSGPNDFPLKMTHTEQDGLDLYANASGSDDCRRAIGFPDHAVVEIKADNAEPDTCSFAEAVRASALKTLHTGLFRQRDYSRDSLALIDPCHLVPADKALDLIGTDRQTRPGIRNCQWAKSGGQGGVALTMDTGLELGANPHEDKNAVELIGDRSSAVAPGTSEGVGTCTVRTVGRSFGITNFEDATVLAVVKGPADQACALARAVAQVAWPQLPKG